MKKWRYTLMLAAVLLLASCQSAQQIDTASEITVIEGATVIDGVSDTPIEDAIPRAVHIHQHAESLLVPWNRIEYRSRRIVMVLKQLGGHPDVGFAISALDNTDVTHFSQLIHPAPKSIVREDSLLLWGGF